MNKYKYTGNAIVAISGVGEVKPGDIIETKVEINHPSFENQGSKKDKSKKKDK